MPWKILIVDDEPNNLQLLRLILKEHYQLGFAKNGEEALRRVREQNPDLILLDIMMPGMDGYSVCGCLKSDPVTAHIPIIFISALDETEDEKKGFELGAVDYINKPVSAPIVLARVHTHLSLHHQQQVCEKTVRTRTAELRETRYQVIQKLGRAAEYKDNETGLHVMRMSHYAQRLAQRLDWDEERCDLIMQAAPMHDVGKIGIPDHILRKPGPLSEEEWTVMKRHPEIGADIIGCSEDKLLTMAHSIALTHHEKWNGSGYPHGLAGEEIPIEGRIIAVADVFDALTSTRPYKHAWQVEVAMDMLEKESGEHFDPHLVDLFSAALPEMLEIKQKWAEKNGT